MEVRKFKDLYTYLPPVRMSKEELAETTERAKELGFNRSEYIRYCVKKEMEGE